MLPKKGQVIVEGVKVAKKAVKILRENGIKAGLFRPITLWPFPQNELENVKKTEESAIKNSVPKFQA